ncbi:MAG: iron-containing redox enzyme family protein [Hyphomonadaceae bacterium]|nr:iron-containing redox enzyme family protein [Hyphomonadaceae bacterium]
MPEGSSRPFAPAHPLADHALHARLARWNRARLAMQTPPADWRGALDDDYRMAIEERQFAEALRAQVAPRAALAPREPAAFVAWFEALKLDGPGQGDALFPWLATQASWDEMRWFIEQEVAGEAGFEDLVALAQIKAPTPAKLELARNYWDEMGRGNLKGMHGPMLERLARALDVKPEIETTLAPSLALGNTMVALGATRAYAYHALGALGVIELTAPTRAVHVAAGLKRLGVTVRDRHYFELHAVLDLKHSEAWNREVLATLVAERPDCARYIAEGALMRLACGEACFEAYRAQLWRKD